MRQDHYAFDQHRVIDTVIMGNRRLWMALTERDALYAKAEMSNEDGMRLGELEGIVGEEDGYSAESDAAVLLQGLDIGDALHERDAWRSCRAGRRSACCWRRRSTGSRTRCCSTSRPTTSTSTRSTGSSSSSAATRER